VEIDELEGHKHRASQEAERGIHLRARGGGCRLGEMAEEFPALAVKGVSAAAQIGEVVWPVESVVTRTPGPPPAQAMLMVVSARGVPAGRLHARVRRQRCSGLASAARFVHCHRPPVTADGSR
jgi:hypothetical protein